MIKLVNHNGFIEPSFGVANEGFAVRKNASVVVKFDSVYPKKINIQLHRTSYDWPNAYIKIRINNNEIHKFKVENIGLKNFSIDLPDPLKRNNLVISFSVYPQGIIKNISKAFLAKRKSLVRDSILISRLYFDENKVINYSNNNRFVHGNLLQQKQNPVRILGFFGQTFGLAEAARRTFTSLEKSGLSVKATQIPYSGKHQGSDNSVKAEKKIPSNTDEIRIFHFNGDHFDKLITDWGESILECKYRIGFWHWELPEFPDDYLPWFDIVDEIWVPSRFVFDAIAPKSPKPVQIIPLPLDDTILKPPPPNREKFNIPKDKIVFLITFDFYSILERKNPIAGIRAFSKLMDDEKLRNKVHLIVKVSNQHADPQGNGNLQKELESIDSDKITLINSVLSRFDMIQLINSCDSLISLHRSEGFGLHLAEAMAMGKAVVATNWSGNTDFMNSKNSYPVDFELYEIEERQGPYKEGNLWAKASESNAIENIKQIINSTLNQSTVEMAKASVIEILSKNKVRTKIEQRLKWIMYNL